jgi:topoisomerase-4 subunit A
VKQFDYDFAKLAIKGKNAAGNQLTKYPVRKVELREKGGSTLGGVKIWWDNITGRLTGDPKGQFLGEFDSDDKVLAIYNDGSYEITNYELINRFEPNELYLIQKFNVEQPIQVIYLDGKSKNHFVKRFVIETSTIGKKFIFISEEKGSKLECASTSNPTLIEVVTENKKGEKKTEELNIAEFMDVKGWKSVGNRLSQETVKKVKLLSEKVGEYEPIELETEDESIDLPEEGEDGSNNQGSSEIKPVTPPPPPPIMNGDNPQLDLL